MDETIWAAFIKRLLNKEERKRYYVLTGLGNHEMSDIIRRNERCFCPGYYLGKRTKLSRARKARAQDTADKCRQSRLSTFNADGMNIQRKDNGRSDRVSRGETDESRTAIRLPYKGQKKKK